MSIIVVKRIETFSAAHRLNSPLLSPADNLSLYGKCNNPNGHGHNYKLEVSVRGRIDPVTGMVINLAELKEIIKLRVLDVFDHTHLDLDHRNLFLNTPSTTENFLFIIAKELKDEISKRFDESTKLYKVVLWETEKNIFEIEFP